MIKNILIISVLAVILAVSLVIPAMESINELSTAIGMAR